MLIVSGNPSVVGDAFEDQWNGQYEMDIYGRPVDEELTIPAELLWAKSVFAFGNAVALLRLGR